MVFYDHCWSITTMDHQGWCGTSHVARDSDKQLYKSAGYQILYQYSQTLRRPQQGINKSQPYRLVDTALRYFLYFGDMTFETLRERPMQLLTEAFVVGQNYDLGHSLLSRHFELGRLPSLGEDCSICIIDTCLRLKAQRIFTIKLVY